MAYFVLVKAVTVITETPDKIEEGKTEAFASPTAFIGTLEVTVTNCEPPATGNANIAGLEEKTML